MIIVHATCGTGSHDYCACHMWNWITWLSCMPHVELDHMIIVHATCGAGSRDHRACHMWSWITWSSCMPHVELDQRANSLAVSHARAHLSTCAGVGRANAHVCHRQQRIFHLDWRTLASASGRWPPISPAMARTQNDTTSIYFAGTVFFFFSFFFFFFFLFFFLTHVRKKKRKKRGKIKRQYEKHLFLSSFLQDGWTSQGPACAYIIIGNNASKKNDQTVTTETDYWIGGCKQEISSSTEW